MKLIWYRRKDGLWNSECACGGTNCGVAFDERAEFEAWHFESRAEERAQDLAKGRNARKPCAAVFPEEDINDPGPREFA